MGPRPFDWTDWPLILMMLLVPITRREDHIPGEGLLEHNVVRDYLVCI